MKPLSAYHRKKQPEQVQRALLDCTARIAAQRGFALVSVQAVAEAAGVTKGGLFHHFPNRKALVDAVVEELVLTFDSTLEAFLAEEGDASGCFTRAYVRAVFAERQRDADDPWMALSIAMLSEPDAQALWTDWLDQRLARHRSTDASPLLEVVRLAADGAWLALSTPAARSQLQDPQALCERLIALSRQA